MNVTSGGIDSGAEPIFERHGGVEENCCRRCEDRDAWKAGSRKRGIEQVSEVYWIALAIRRVEGLSIVPEYVERRIVGEVEVEISVNAES